MPWREPGFGSTGLASGAGTSRPTRRDADGGNIVPCSQCPVARVCLPADVPPEQVPRIEGMILRQRSLNPGQYLYRVGEEFTSLFAVRSGCLKSTVPDPEGREQILNFHLAGEVLDFSAIYHLRYAGNAIALSRVTVCHLSFSEILRLSQEFPQLVLGLLRIASCAALFTGRLGGDHRSQVRVAAFLVSLSSRLKALGLSATEFELFMSREDIANHLRLAPETVSRVFTRMRADGVIAVQRRFVRVLDENQLRQLAGPMMPYGWER